jgi:hypothetical protein
MIGWTVTAHARDRMHEMGVREREVRAAVEDPEVDYVDRDGRVRVGGRLAIPYNPATNTIVTVLWRGKTSRSEQGPDQSPRDPFSRDSVSSST